MEEKVVLKEDCKDCCETVEISTKRMYLLLIHVEELLVEGGDYKKQVLQVLEGLKWDIRLLNNVDDSSLSRDLYD